MGALHPFFYYYMDTSLLTTELKTALGKEYNVLCFNSLCSTNEYLKSDKIPVNTLAVAFSQTAGKGTKGRSFYSPENSGIYFSIKLKSEEDIKDNLLYTPAAAVAVAKAAEKCFNVTPKIKWVNDLYLGGKKICGILSETKDEATVIGIGVNLFKPKEIPNELKDIFGYINNEYNESIIAPFVAEVVKNLVGYKNNLLAVPFLSDYKSRFMLTNKEITVNGEYTATVLGVNDDFSLKISANGTVKSLISADIKIKE